MDMTLFYCLLFFCFIMFSLAEAMHGTHSPIGSSFCFLTSGLAALYTAHLLESFTGIDVPISVLTLCMAAVGGIPAVALIMLLNLFFV